MENSSYCIYNVPQVPKTINALARNVKIWTYRDLNPGPFTKSRCEAKIIPLDHAPNSFIYSLFNNIINFDIFRHHVDHYRSLGAKYFISCKLQIEISKILISKRGLFFFKVWRQWRYKSSFERRLLINLKSRYSPQLTS